MIKIKQIFKTLIRVAERIKYVKSIIENMVKEMLLAGVVMDMYISNYNRKLKPTKLVKFLIWNLPAVATCPYATKECTDNCYALKSESAYPDCLPARVRNYYRSKQNDFVMLMCNFIDHNMTRRPTYKFAKRVYFRIHESGDFYSFDYFCKWMEIVKYASKYKNLQFVAYTKSVPFIELYVKKFGALPENISIISSVWSDTKQKYIDMTNRLNLPIYTADTEKNVDLLVKNKNNFKCKCEDCANCTACFEKKYKKIACVIH